MIASASPFAFTTDDLYVLVIVVVLLIALFTYVVYEDTNGTPDQ